MTNLRAFSRWMTQAILAWRDQARSRSPLYPSEERGPILRFDAPCQVDVLHLLHPHHRLDFRLCVIRHFQDEPDLTIHVLGPYQPAAFPAGVETYIASSLWDRPLPEADLRGGLWPPYGAMRYREVMERAIGNVYASAQTYLNNTMKSEGVDGRTYGMAALPGGCWGWGIAGRIEKAYPDAAVYVSEEIEKERRAFAARAKSSGATAQLPKRVGLGAFLLPPVWVGEAPRPSLRERLEGVRPALAAHRQVAISTSYAGSELLVTRSGCFLLATEDREKTAAILNELFSMALFMDQATMSVAPTDFVVMSDFEAPFTSYEYEDTLSSDQQARLEGEPAWSFDVRSHPVLPSSRIEDIVQAAAKLPPDPQRALVMRFTLDAWSHLSKRDHRNAFLSAWTGIELTVNALWARQLSEKAVVGDRRRRLLAWEAGRVLEVLQLNSVIPPALFGRLERARRLRNDVLHSGASVPSKGAREGIVSLIELAVSAWNLPVPRNLLDDLVHEGTPIERLIGYTGHIE